MQLPVQSAASAPHWDGSTATGGGALGGGALDDEAISDGALHAWLVDLDGPVAAGTAGLDASERARAASFVRPQDCARFAASRGALRLILARYLGRQPEDVRFRVGPHGAPCVATGEVRFSLARSGGLALVAVSRGPVGADLEQVAPRPGLADLAAARFPAREAARLANSCCGSPALSFYRHWTAKEAYLKAIGLGLAGLRDAELVCGARPVIWFAGRPAGAWSLSMAGVAAVHLAAIASPSTVTSWRWLSSGGSLPPRPTAGLCR